MHDASDIERCPRCGAEFSGTASPLGLCPACLLKLGMSDPAWTPPPSLVPEAELVAPIAPPPHAPAPRLRLPSRRSWMLAAAVLVIVAAAAFLLLLLRARDNSGGRPPNVVRFTLPFPDETEPLDGAQFAVSPDGTQVALAARGRAGQQRLWVRRLQSLEWRELTQTESAAFPFWSPDSRHVGFFTDRSLKRIDVTSGLTQTLCDTRAGRGGAWSREGVIVFAASSAGPLSRVPASGGTPRPVTSLDESRHEVAHRWPHFLPDGRLFVYVVDAAGQAGSGVAGTYVGSLDTGEKRLLVPGGGTARFAGSALLFVRGTQLVAQRFDTARSELVDDPQSVGGAEQIGGARTRGSGFSASEAVLVYESGAPVVSQLMWTDRAGRLVGPAGDSADYESFSVSRDGRRVAAALRDARDGMSSIWLLDAARGAASPLTIGSAPDRSPVWSPDGTRLVFASRRDGAGDLYLTEASGGGREETLLRSQESKRPTDWSADGRFLLYSTSSTKTGADVWVLPLAEDRKPQPLVQTSFNESQGRFSPDGRWVAYVSDQSGRDEVYVRGFPQPDGRWQVSTDGGSHPRWGRDGRELFFVSAGGRLMAVPIQSGPTPDVGTPRPLFVMRESDGYDTAPDGRFLVKMPVREHDTNSLHVILNWAEELRR